MAEREINCCECGKHVGIIRDAKLMVGLKFICPSCHEKMNDTYDFGSNTDWLTKGNKESFTDIFNNIFSSKYKK
jgi:phage FluMu protein Com